MLASRHFFSAYTYPQRIKTAVEVVLVAHAATVEGLVSQRALVAGLEAMGQNLFAPPNVKGWPGGAAWLSTATLVARQNFGQALATGTLWGNFIRPLTEDEEAFNALIGEAET